MKLLVSMAIAVTMGVGLVAGANASPTYDKVLIGMKAEYNGITQATCTYGTQSGALDGLDALDAEHGPAYAGCAELICTDLGPGRWAVDKRAPFGFAVKYWNLKAYLNGVPNGGDMVIKAWVISTGKITNTDVYAKLYEGQGTGGTLLWTAPFNSSGTSTNPQFTSGAYATSGSGVRFFALVMGSPEPSGMIAMLSGLAGLIGFAIRPRKLTKCDSPARNLRNLVILPG